ncbi:MAG: dihydrodipicolinate synthase family protein [Candidatus Poribacteria bacterium]|nr:dihydrodipicolinate synthase family protein [Candidatus Poribacteria bacterium]
MTNQRLIEALGGVTTIPIIPFQHGKIDWGAHRLNTEYLMETNTLDGGLPRIIAHAGTSLIHYLSVDEQVEIIERTGEIMGREGVLMSAIIPGHPQETVDLINRQADSKRPPDVYLLMSLTGVCSSEGVYDGLREIAETADVPCVYYHRRSSDNEQVIRLMNDCEQFVGVKIGTNTNDVKPIVNGIGDNGIAIWGKGDLATDAAELGTRGHTSGIAVLFAKAADAINNAQRKGDFAAARKVEADIKPLEDIRFEGNRELNYSAVVLGMNLCGFDDIKGGAGGRFNPLPTDEATIRRVSEAVVPYKRWH